MSRDVNPDHPKNNDDLIYLAQRNLLSDKWVEKLGGPEGVSELLLGEKVVRFTSKGSKGADAEPDAEDDTEPAAADADADAK